MPNCGTVLFIPGTASRSLWLPLPTIRWRKSSISRKLQTDKLNEVLESVVLLQEFMEEMDYGGMETILQDGSPAEEENL